MSPELPNDDIMRAIHNIFNIQDEITMNSSGDLFVKGTGIRIGYFSGITLFCENIVTRALGNRGFEIHEGSVDWNHEPQYDLRITFNEDGSIKMMSSNRMPMEIEFTKKRQAKKSLIRKCDICKSTKCIELQGSGPDPNTDNIELAFQCTTCGHEWTEITP